MKTDIEQNEMPYYHIFLDEIDDPALILDEKGVVRDVNKCCCELLRYSRDEIAGKLIHDFLDGDKKQVFGISIENEDNGKRKEILTFVTQDNRKITAPIFLIPIHRPNTMKKKHFIAIMENEDSINMKPNSNNDLASIAEKIHEISDMLNSMNGINNVCTRIKVTPLLRNPFATMSSLSGVEARVAELLAGGKTSAEIGDVMHISEKTVETHRRHIRKKLGIKNKKTNLRSFLLSMGE